MSSVKSGDEKHVRVPATITKKAGSAIDPEVEYPPYLTLSVTKRTDGRLEDVVHSWNEFEAEVALTFPPGFELWMMDHPQMLEAGYSLLGARPLSIFSPEGSSIKISFFKLSQQEDLDLPSSAVLIYAARKLIVPFPMSKKEKEAPKTKTLKNSRGGAKKKKKVSSSEEEEEEEAPQKKPSRVNKRW